MSKIFISYRRSDSEHMTDRLYDDLIAHFGRDSVFRDAQSIGGGQDFTHAIKNALEESSVLLIVIGQSWSETLKTRAEQREMDWVHFEIEAGLERHERDKLHIIPVRIDDAPFPDQQDLPKTLRPLARLNAVPLRTGRDYERDLQDLIALIAPHLGIQAEATTAASSVTLIPDDLLPIPSTALTPDHHEALPGDPIQPDEPVSVSRTQAMAAHLKRNWQFWLGTMLLPIVLLIVGFVWTASQSQNSTTPPTATPTPAPFAATLYFGRSLTLHFEGASALNSVQLLTDKNSSTPNHLDDDFRQYFPGGVIESELCLQYQVEGSTITSPPRVCRDLNIRSVTVSDPFWIDLMNDTMMPIQFFKDERQLGTICQPDEGPCHVTE